MVSFSDLLRSMSPTKGHGWKIKIPESWLQGRATFGGLSAALCLEAVNRNYPDLPPLRTAQITFLGPTGNNAIINSQVLRQGKSVIYIRAEIINDAGIATSAVFSFGTTRPSQLDQNFVAPPDVPAPQDSVDLFKLAPAPAFTQNFECRHCSGSLPLSGLEQAEFGFWVRHKDKSANDLVALLCIADMAPPAILSVLTKFAPVSTMTWMLNFLNEQPQTQDGWWQMHSKAQNAKDGYSSENMNIWNSDGELSVVGLQNVTIFH